MATDVDGFWCGVFVTGLMWLSYVIGRRPRKQKEDTDA